MIYKITMPKIYSTRGRAKKQPSFPCDQRITNVLFHEAKDVSVVQVAAGPTQLRAGQEGLDGLQLARQFLQGQEI